MLHLATVYSDTLELLKELMGRDEFKAFSLAGGTALALQIGHRISVDLDFFGKHAFNPEEILAVYAEIGRYQLLTQSKNVLVVSIKNIKVDVVNYRYDLLEPPLQIDNLRVLSLVDHQLPKKYIIGPTTNIPKRINNPRPTKNISDQRAK